MIEYADGGIETVYGGQIKLSRRYLSVERGLEIIGTSISLEQSIFDMQGIRIIKEELKNVTLDLDIMNKLLGGGPDDREVAYELLGTQTKYVVPIMKALIDNNHRDLQIQIRLYVQNNKLKLSKEIL